MALPRLSCATMPSRPSVDTTVVLIPTVAGSNARAATTQYSIPTADEIAELSTSAMPSRFRGSRQPVARARSRATGEGAAGITGSSCNGDPTALCSGRRQADPGQHRAVVAARDREHGEAGGPRLRGHEHVVDLDAAPRRHARGERADQALAGAVGGAAAPAQDRAEGGVV